MPGMACEVCGDWRVVLAQYGVKLKDLGLDGRFCSSHLEEKLQEYEDEYEDE